MKIEGKSIRTFIGSKDYNESRSFYRALGFREFVTSENMSYFSMGNLGFYLQDAYVKDWIDNTMIFLEVEDLDATLEHIRSLQLTKKYKNVRLSDIVYNDWGNEFFLHDPCGILWHFGIFKSKEVS
jgi:catechol 2,3-dioxygenase-like lactoylglutathione lyase family enzyme